MKPNLTILVLSVFLFVFASPSLHALDTESGIAKATLKDGEIHFSNGIVELRFSSKTGRWLSLYDDTAKQPILINGSYIAPVNITAGGRTMEISGRNQIHSLIDTQTAGPNLILVSWDTERKDKLNWLVLKTVEGNWEILQYYGLEDNDATIHRYVRITWKGEDEILLRWVDLRTPMPTPTEECILEAPGYPGVLHQKLDELPMGRWTEISGDAPAWRPGLLAVRHDNTNLLMWGFSREIPSELMINRGDIGVWFTHRFLASCRLQKNQSVDAGMQYLRLHKGKFYDALSEFQPFWKEADIKFYGNIPDWAKDARIYEIHLGRWRSYEPYPDIHALTEDLPRIAGLGFNAIEIMPRFPYPNYRVHDYENIEIHYAPEQELREMIDRAHELNMKVMLDVVLHGVTARPNEFFDIHPWLAQHPDWFCYNEYGDLSKTYTWAFDCSSPSFQEYMVKVFAGYVEKLNVDGFRVDAVTWNFFPNWAENLPRPAYANFYGNSELLDRVLNKIITIKPDIVLYTESFGPLFYRSCYFSYGYDELWFHKALLPLIPGQENDYVGGYWGGQDAKINAREMAEWLEMRRLMWPEGFCRVHHVDSHDTYQWVQHKMFRREAFGIEAARLLFAFCAFIDGSIMNYVGAEKGSEDFYRKVLSLRTSIPALHEGTCDYLAVAPENDRVFAPLRRYRDQWALPVLSFSTDPVTTEIPLDALALDEETTYTLYEVFSGMKRTGKGIELARLSVVLPPYGVQLWIPYMPK